MRTKKYLSLKNIKNSNELSGFYLILSIEKKNSLTAINYLYYFFYRANKLHCIREILIT